MPLKTWLESIWYSDQPAPFWLLPFSWLYGVISRRRRVSLTAEAERLPAPVIVVGNISLGGTGKTPFVIWLVERLREWGYTPGVISRGYGGEAPQYPMAVHSESNPVYCGDEPLLMARRLNVPVVIDPDRRAAARFLLTQNPTVNVLVADDGLQHYRLARDLEICIVDGMRGLGNGALIPAGPLREAPARLREVQLAVVNGGGWRGDAPEHADMFLRMTEAHTFTGAREPMAAFKGRTVHAVAGIGNPERFFGQLRWQGINVIPHAFPDHHAFTASDFNFIDTHPVLMTEKDAVKCLAFAQPHWRFVPVVADLHADYTALVRKLVNSLKR
ncbi:MAG: tetraacyldisaccharide 4'-kinase [Pseudomonadota bacterium]